MPAGNRAWLPSRLLLLVSGVVPVALFLLAAWFDYRAVTAAPANTS